MLVTRGQRMPSRRAHCTLRHQSGCRVTATASEHSKHVPSMYVPATGVFTVP